jgi:hypothetical protein
LHGSCRAIAILRIEQGKKQIVAGASDAAPKSLRVAVDQLNFRVDNSRSQAPTPDPSAPLRAFWSRGSLPRKGRSGSIMLRLLSALAYQISH